MDAKPNTSIYKAINSEEADHRTMYMYYHLIIIEVEGFCNQM